jgi:hypothetical protein
MSIQKMVQRYGRLAWLVGTGLTLAGISQHQGQGWMNAQVIQGLTVTELSGTSNIYCQIIYNSILKMTCAE